MFGFRPYVPGFNVEPPAEPEVPGFRMNADGTVRTDDAASGQPRSYTPVGWSSVSDQLGNAEIALTRTARPTGMTFGMQQNSSEAERTPW